MKITALVENTSNRPELRSEHGLSLLIEWNDRRILFDTGASELFAENAEKLGIDLALVDRLVLSHGHYDHGGGLKKFLTLNDRARIYIRTNAFDRMVAEKPEGGFENIGLEPTIQFNERIQFTEGQSLIEDGLEVFSHVTGSVLSPSGNSDLKRQAGNAFIQDDFGHEQNLIIREGDNLLLLTGCAHRGIVNILEYFKQERGEYPTHVMGGFHLHNLTADQDEAPETVNKIGEYLNSTGALCYTCHCTGKNSYQRLKDVMGDRINYLATGDTIII